MWFHVDGAHGAAQIFSKQHRTPLEGLHRADSVAMDFHKMLGIPALCTGLFYRSSQDAYSAFSQRADYLYEQGEQDEWWNLSKRTFECTKRMLSVAVLESGNSMDPNYGKAWWINWWEMHKRLPQRCKAVKVGNFLLHQNPTLYVFDRTDGTMRCYENG